MALAQGQLDLRHLELRQLDLRHLELRHCEASDADGSRDRIHSRARLVLCRAHRDLSRRTVLERDRMRRSERPTIYRLASN
jgi:hypothetical protein